MLKYCYPCLIYKEVGGWLCVFLVFLNRKKYLFLKIIALKMNLILFFFVPLYYKNDKYWLDK